MVAPRRVVFVGLSGYAYPHTRVRCFHFARELAKYPDMETDVVSYRDHLAPEFSEVDMFGGVRDLRKLALAWRGLRRLWREKNALLYVQKIHYHAAAPYLLYRLGRNPYVFDYDDYDVELSVLFRRGTLNRLVFGSRDWLEITRRFARNARACVVSSHLLLEIVGAWNPRVHLIHTGVDPEHFVPCVRNRETVRVLWTGLVWGQEIFDNVSFLLRCFARARERVAPLELHIVGGGQYIDRVKELIAERYGGQPIQLVEWVDPTQMPQVLAAADIGALPLIQTDRWTRAKSPTKLFEYMASGLAVVASDNGEARHVIAHEQDGLLAADENAFTEQLVTLGCDAALRARLGAAARQTVVERYSLPVLGRRLHNVLISL